MSGWYDFFTMKFEPPDQIIQIVLAISIHFVCGCFKDFNGWSMTTPSGRNPWAPTSFVLPSKHFLRSTDWSEWSESGRKKEHIDIIKKWVLKRFEQMGINLTCDPGCEKHTTLTRQTKPSRPSLPMGLRTVDVSLHPVSSPAPSYNDTHPTYPRLSRR